MQKTRNTAETDLTGDIYKFSNLLEIAEIVSRSNRFIMNVKIADEIIKGAFKIEVRRSILRS